MFDGVSAGITPNVRNLCRCGVRIPSTPNRCPAFNKDKYLEPMFCDVGQTRINARRCITADCYNLKPPLQKTHPTLYKGLQRDVAFSLLKIHRLNATSGTLLRIKKLQALQKNDTCTKTGSTSKNHALQMPLLQNRYTGNH